jgi:hypothetical protein
MAHGDAREGKWGGKWRMKSVAGTLHTTSERGVSNITTADAHTSAASSRLNWRPRRFKWTRPFRRKKKSGFYTCAITSQTQSTAGDFTEVTQKFWFSHKITWDIKSLQTTSQLCAMTHAVSKSRIDFGMFNGAVSSLKPNCFYICISTFSAEGSKFYPQSVFMYFTRFSQ